MRFPKRIRHRGQVLATIYAKTKAFPAYRLAWRVTGQRRMERFQSYSEVKRRADALVKELAQGSHVTALTPKQATDALAALERLQGFFQQTGRRASLLAAVTEYVEASARLNGRTLPEAIDGYLANVASVKRKDIASAVDEFLQTQAPLTKATNGQRAQLCAKYAYNRQIQLRRFAAAFPNTAVCDLSKEHLDAFLGSLSELSAKSRNHYRAAVRQFLQWAVRKDYLTVTHRLGEADGLRPEHGNTAEVALYSPRELAALLDCADETLRPLIAIGGLAGLRTAELLRLDWSDGHNRQDRWIRAQQIRGEVQMAFGKGGQRSPPEVILPLFQRNPAELGLKIPLLTRPKSDTKEPPSKLICDTSQKFSVAPATVSSENREFKGENRRLHAPNRARLGVLLSKALRGAADEGALSPRLFAIWLSSELRV